MGAWPPGGIRNENWELESNIALRFGEKEKEAPSHRLLAMVPTAASGVAAHAKLGNVRGPLALPLAAGTLCGAYCGGQLARRIDDEPMKLGFGALMGFLGARTLLK